MVRVLNIVLAVLNIAMFAAMGLLIFKSNTLLSTLGIPHENGDKEVEGFTFREVTLTPKHTILRNRVQTLGYF